MQSESLRKQVLLKTIKKDVEVALTLQEISKSDLIKMIRYFAMKAEALSE
ncbi:MULTISPECIES: hypothetical protein [Aliivibrio]|jgi:hypothetical protein|nr:hypothetical protein [Aliivibrio sifiae]